MAMIGSLLWRLDVGDVIAQLRGWRERSVHCVITSPPYWRLRDYGVAGQIGNEDTPAEYVAKLVEVFAEVHRVLRDDGTVWLNLGDSYANAGEPQAHNLAALADRLAPGANPRRPNAYDDDQIARPTREIPEGFKPKDMIGIPWRVAFALQEWGWYLRCDVVWSKPNPLPESVTDRPAKNHEYIFMLTKTDRYYYDPEAVKEPSSPYTNLRASKAATAAEMERRAAGGLSTGSLIGVHPKAGTIEEANARRREGNRQNASFSASVSLPVTSRNRRSVWEITTQGFTGEFCTKCERFFDGPSKSLIRERHEMREGEKVRIRTCVCGAEDGWLAHFATFPEALPEICIKASTSERGCCPTCGTPYRRIVAEGEPNLIHQRASGGNAEGEYHGESRHDYSATRAQTPSDVKRRILAGMVEKITIGWRPLCGCAVGAPEELDAFEEIATQLGADGIEDDCKATGRKGFNRPRLPGQGVRTITRYEQRRYARQLRAIMRDEGALEGRQRFAQIEQEAGPEALAHYMREDRAGARPIPPKLLDLWITRGWLRRVEIPNLESLSASPCVVADIFTGSGTVGVVALALGRSFHGIELKRQYATMARERIGAVAPLLASEV